MSYSDEEYTIPLENQRAFGAGLKRKRIHFIPSSDSAATNSATQSHRSVSETYLSIVLTKSSEGSVSQSSETDTSIAVTDEQICDTCSLPNPYHSVSTPHGATLVHQLSLPHSHPPSALPHNRRGLRILRAKGWDPDARIGLGATGEGIRFPIKAKEKNDKLGIGMVVPKPKKGCLDVARVAAQGISRAEKKQEQQIGRVGKGWLKKTREEEMRRSEKLRQLFFESEDVSRYLS